MSRTGGTVRDGTSSSRRDLVYWSRLRDSWTPGRGESGEDPTTPDGLLTPRDLRRRLVVLVPTSVGTGRPKTDIQTSGRLDRGSSGTTDTNGDLFTEALRERFETSRTDAGRLGLGE